MRLLLVDDNANYRNGLKDFLEMNGFIVLGTAANALEAIAKIEMLQPDFILMDVQMAGCDGIEATRIIKKDFPEIEIIMLSVSEDRQHLFEAVCAGASGYLLKTMDNQHLLTKLRSISEGEAPLAPGLANKILREFAKLNDQSKKLPHKPDIELQDIMELTPRQKDVLKCMGRGMTYREIGEELNIQEVTVRYHVNEALRKLHLANRMELLANLSMLDL